MRFEFEDPAGARHVLVTLGRPRGRLWPATLDGAMVALWVERWMDTRGRLAAFRGGGLDFAATATMFGRDWQVRCGERAFPAVEAEEEHVDPAAPAGPANEFVNPFAGFVALLETGWKPPPGGDVPDGARRVAEFSRSMHESAPRPWVTQGIVAANAIVFVAMAASGVSPWLPEAGEALAWGADSGPSLTAGQWWRLFTSMFVHFGILHLAFNMMVLADAGPFLERLLGRPAYAVLYVLSGLAGSVASVWWHPFGVGAGASGAIFGVYGGLLGVLLLRRDVIPVEALSPMRSAVVKFIVYNLLISLAVPFISLAAHAGGLVGGFLAGMALSRRFTPEAVAGQRRRIPIVAVLGLGAILGLTAALPPVDDPMPPMREAAGVESRLIDAYNADLVRVRDGEIHPVEMARTVEEEILPAWRKAIAPLEKLRGAPEEVALFLEYARARERAWTLRAAALRSGEAGDASAAGAQEEVVARLLARINRRGP